MLSRLKVVIVPCAYIILMRKRIHGLRLAAVLAVAATVASTSPAYATKKNILHVITARNANVTVTICPPHARDFSHE